MKPIPAGFAITTDTRESASGTNKPLYVTSAVVFAGAVAATVAMSRSMSGGMDMPGSWTMSMAWMKMPEQTALGAALMFAAMWLAMMLAMMMPSLAAMLAGYRRALRRLGETHVD